MNLPRKRKGPPRRTRHPIRPPWEMGPDELAVREVLASADVENVERTDPEYRARVDQVQAEAGGMCVARLEGCQRVGSQPHHVYPVSEGGNVLVPPVWMRWVCPSCHGIIHSGNGRREAEALGLIVPRRIKH